MIIVDTTIMVYASGDAHSLQAPCQKLLAAQTSRQIDASTTLEVIQEFAHVRARRRPRADAAELARAFIMLLDPLPTQATDLVLGLRIYETVPALGAFDAVLAAVALNRNAETLVSADRAFGGVPGLRWVDPATTDLDALLRG